MVGYGKAIQRLWTGKCNVIVRQGQLNKDNGRTEFIELTVYENVPCRLSFKSVTAANEVANATVATNVVKLFLGKDVPVPVGSKLVVTQNDVVGEYVGSGQAAVYSEHQEVVLERFKEWA